MSNEDRRRISIVGNYTHPQSDPDDCLRCHDAKWATPVIDGYCLDCYIHNFMGTQMPSHIEFGNDCCGVFNVLTDRGLYCNECGINICEAISILIKEIKP